MPNSIILFLSSPTYQVSTSSAVHNSKDFVSFVHSINLDEDVPVSFDVVSLFAKVPVNLALQNAHTRLQMMILLTCIAVSSWLPSCRSCHCASMLHIFPIPGSFLQASLLALLWDPWSP